MFKKEILFEKVDIITVAKVGSANFLHCNYSSTKNKTHAHDLLKLKNILNNNRNSLIIVGIRNPIDRNLSYLFQTFNDRSYNDLRTKKNKYKGEYCHIPEICGNNSIPIWKDPMQKIIIKPEKMIDLYFKKNYHNTFNEWFEEFLEITNIKKFNKEKGLDFYEFPNNNTIMIYTMEKLDQNKEYICDLLGITNFKNRNNSNKRAYSKLYKEVKNKIVYTKEYLNNLLNTEIMHIFYSDLDIENFYLKYKTY